MDLNESEINNKQGQLLQTIQNVNSQLENLSLDDQDNIIMIVGRTGCGKSTIFNFLCGAQFQVIEDQDGDFKLDLVTYRDHFQQMNGGLDSTTKIPKIYYSQRYQHSIIDYPGFNDTEKKDQIETQLLFNKIVSQRKIKFVYVLFNTGSQFQNKADDLQDFICEVEIDISKLIIIINSYNKNKTNEKLITDLQSQLFKKYQKEAHKIIILREVDDQQKVSKYLSDECRDQMWIQLISSQAVIMKPYILNVYQDANNFIVSITLTLFDALQEYINKEQQKDYSVSQIQQLKEKICFLKEKSLIFDQFIEGDNNTLNQIMILSGKFSQDQINGISIIYQFFLNFKNKLNGFADLHHIIYKTVKKLNLCIEYLNIKLPFLELLFQAELKIELFEAEKRILKSERSELEDLLQEKENQIILKEKEFEQNLKLLKQQNLEQKQVYDDLCIKNQQAQTQLQLLQEKHNSQLEEFIKIKHEYNELQIELKSKQFDLQISSSQINSANEDNKRLVNQQKESLFQNQKLLEDYKRIKIKKKELTKGLKDVELQNTQLLNDLTDLKLSILKEKEWRNQLEFTLSQEVKERALEQSQLKETIKKKDDEIHFLLQKQSKLEQTQGCKFELIDQDQFHFRDVVCAMAINQDNSIVVFGGEAIYVFELVQGKLKQQSILDGHKLRIMTLNFMKKSNKFVSGSADFQIKIWQKENDRWTCEHILSEHSNNISCVILNINENLIISGSCDSKIKFWVNKQYLLNKFNWVCSQSITDHTDTVYSLSLNDKQNQVISCSRDKFILVIEQQQNKWQVIQKIKLDVLGYRLCFIKNNQFIFQPGAKENLHLYEINLSSNKYFKQKQFVVKSDSPDDTCFFPYNIVNINAF